MLENSVILVEFCSTVLTKHASYHFQDVARYEIERSVFY